MAKSRLPMTQAIRMLKKSGVPYTLHSYKYEEKGGTGTAATALHVDEHIVLKTLIMEDHVGAPMVVIMHGDRQVSTKALARQLNAKTVAPCDHKTAQKHTGYLVGGTSPFGLKKPLPVYMEASIKDLPEVFVNAGKRGLLVKIRSRDLISLIKPIPVNAAI